MGPPIDEEALSAHVPLAQRKARGVFFTPRPVVERALAALAPWVPREGPAHVVDPACGAGAFLVAAAERWPQAALHGLELDAVSAAQCRARAPRVHLHEGDALAAPWLPPEAGGFALVVGNPPWNGRSPLLRRKAAWAVACEWLPPQLRPSRGTSLRDDFVFFLLKASLLLEQRAGCLAFLTPATLLDAWAHAPVRAALCSRLALREVLEWPAGTFARTQTRACLTVWTAPRPRRPALASVGAAPLAPSGPEWRLRPVPDEAAALHRDWAARGEPLTELVPVTFPGLKTRFDELLVDDDAARLCARVEAFLLATPATLPAFARAHGLTPLLPKLEALQSLSRGARFSPAHVRRFHRYRGALARRPSAWCYLDRLLIPRGDHRLRGAYDPHREPLKLVFNLRELPLAAAVFDEPGCVTAYRHARFAPAFVPRALLRDAHARDFDPEDLVPNLSEAGRRFGTPREVFAHVARHVASRAFQSVWAPAFGTTQVPPVPLDAQR